MTLHLTFQIDLNLNRDVTEVHAVPVEIGLGSGGESGHEIYQQFRTGELDGVDFKRVPTDEVQHASQWLGRLNGAWATHE